MMIKPCCVIISMKRSYGPAQPATPVCRNVRLISINRPLSSTYAVTSSWKKEQRPLRSKPCSITLKITEHLGNILLKTGCNGQMILKCMSQNPEEKEYNSMETQQIVVPVMAELFARNEKPEYLFWVGCAGAFDNRYTSVTRAFVKILTYLDITYAVLGKEESCTGDPARRAGNEMLFQMQAIHNIEVFNRYDIKKILTICPHCFNILKNEYPELGGNYEVIHHTVFIQQLIDEGKIIMKENGAFKGKKIT